MKYVDQFLKWNCFPDIADAIHNFGSSPAKEITEAMAIRNRIVDIALKDKMKYYVLDLCAGTGLVGVFSIFTLPIKGAISIDKFKRKNNDYSKIKRYIFDENNIYKNFKFGKCDKIILTSVHPCKNLAKRVIEIYNTYDQIKHLILMPCCGGGKVHTIGWKTFADKYIRIKKKYYKAMLRKINDNL